jgi:DNA-binding IclR family transcriptional regulator
VTEIIKKSKYKSTVPAVEQAMQLLNCLAESSTPQLTLTEICSRLEISNSKAFTILNTLVGYDFVEKNSQTKTYSLGLGVVYLARNILNNLDVRSLVARPLKKLAEESELTAHFGLITGSRVYVIAQEESNQIFGYSMKIGVQHHLTHGSHGKAVVAYMAEEERNAVLAQEDLCFYGDGVPFDMSKLLKELEEVRRTGYAVDAKETNPNITGISSPVFNGDGTVIGCVILVGAFARAKVKKKASLVVDTATEISRSMGYTGKFPVVD